MPDSMRSISAALIRASLRLSCCSRATWASRSASASGNGDPGERLVDVHAIELFSVGVEAHHPLVAQIAADRLEGAVVFQFQAPQETVAANGQQQVAKA